MKAESKLAYTFGNFPPYLVEATTFLPNLSATESAAVRGLTVATRTIELERPTIDPDRYAQAIEDVNATWSVITDKTTGKTFEVAVANLEAPAENGFDAEMSTFTSSISGNPGNAVEFAENSALNSDRRRIYIASFGNGGSSYWGTDEQNYVKKTGRFVQKNRDALPTVAALDRALRASDFIISRFSAKSAGAAYATALMAAMPEGQVSHAILKGRPNISDHPLALAWGAGVLIGDILDDRKYSKISNDPWKMTGDLIDQAKLRLPAIYSEEAQNQHRTTMQKAQTSHALGKMLTDMQAVSKGGPGQNFPAPRDTVQAISRQPEAKLTYHFPLQDRLYKKERDLKAFLVQTHKLRKVAIANNQIELLTMPGRHRDHTHYPGLGWATEQYAFNR